MSAESFEAQGDDVIERAAEVIREHVNLCACGHDSTGEHNSLGCYARLSYEPLVTCDCKRDHGDGTTTHVIARALAAAGLLALDVDAIKAKAWDEGKSAAVNAHPSQWSSITNPYRTDRLDNRQGKA